MKNPLPMPRYPAGPPSTAYIYRPGIPEVLDENNGFFRIVEGSHRMTRKEIDRTEATPIRLEPNEVLLMSAALTIEYPESGGGVGIWRAVTR
jgi:hypothetical protein